MDRRGTISGHGERAETSNLLQPYSFSPSLQRRKICRPNRLRTSSTKKPWSTTFQALRSVMHPRYPCACSLIYSPLIYVLISFLCSGSLLLALSHTFCCPSFTTTPSIFLVLLFLYQTESTNVSSSLLHTFFARSPHTIKIIVHSRITPLPVLRAALLGTGIPIRTGRAAQDRDSAAAATTADISFFSGRQRSGERGRRDGRRQSLSQAAHFGQC